jgi:serine phosphatase RsbU (regulator of sigma subunit)/anti-sigma regulatory factor (Ser/Thr protein kinase)
MSEHPIPAERGVSNRVVFKCDLTDARTATRILRTFLAEQGLDESELFNCELCLAEACNNAVQYVADTAAQEPVIAEAICHHTGVELRVTDHTNGFELHERPATLDPQRENGRGLFIIQSLMDEVRYYRGTQRNTLVMRKSRTHQQHRPAHDAAVANLEDARRQLESCQQTISGMASDLCVRSETLAAIFRCCAELGRTSDLEGFGRRLLNDLLHLTAADWFVLRLVPVGDSRLSVFVVSEPSLHTDPLPLHAADATTSAELGAARARREVEFDARRAAARLEPLCQAGPKAVGVVHPLLFNDTLIGTIAIGRREPAPFSALQSEMIRTFTEFMAVQVINARHVEEQMHARIVAHELDIAHRIQRALLPRTLPQLAGFTLAASWESARQVGGDFYDAIMLDDHTLLLVVADVMGKGVPAAMFATIMRSLVHALVGRSRHPAKLLRRLNELLYAELSSVGMFITAQLVVVDLHRRELVAASAGHCPVIVASGDHVRPLRMAGMPLGVLPDVRYREQKVALAAPAGLLLYTDGLTEALNPAGEMFGSERLTAWLRDRFAQSMKAEALRDALVAELNGFCGGEPLRDDQAFMVLAEEAPVVAMRGRTNTATTGDFHPADVTACSRNFIFPLDPALGIQS